ncbi:MAG: LAGLIDADG family homing endonuclease [Candidatus Pacearchaeota archaeon]|nr:LAGLIDADG family homing endonuclease [Candidatus Pacearchaeota archaeon]
MRINLVKGKQKELIEVIKVGRTWPELGRLLGVNSVYLRNELRNEKRFLSEQIYNKICEVNGESYEEYILTRLDDNWGRSKGGINSLGNTKEINYPDESEELAEFYGIMLGDGNLTKKKDYRVGTYQMRIAGDSRYDKEYLLSYVKPLIEGLFCIKVNHFKQKNKNAYYLSITGRKLAEFMESKGFKPGNKISNELDIPFWIKKNKSFLSACLRGLFDTDGGIYRLNNQNSIQIVFTNFNKRLLSDTRDSLIFLGINPSKITMNKKIAITKRSELQKFLKEVGFSNSKHYRKVGTWEKLIYSPVV